MTELWDVHPEDFVQAGAVFGQVADEVDDCVQRARTSAAVRWVGRPNQAYQHRLGALVVDLGRISDAYGQACDALLSYGRALADARDLALQADLLAGQAAGLARTRQLRSMRVDVDVSAATPDEVVLTEQAARLRREAPALAELASQRLVRRLRDLAGDAPHVSRWTSLDRGTARFVGGAEEAITGTALLAGDLLLAVPGVTSGHDRAQARHELWEGATSAVQVWRPVTDTLEAYAHGDYAHSTGALAGGLILSRFGGKKLDLFGGHDVLPPAVLAALRSPLAPWVLERAQDSFFAELGRFAKLPAPTVDVLLRDGVDLVQQEALGGHTILKHLGRDLDFLRRRQLWEYPAGRERGPISTFLDQTEAELLIDRTMRIPSNAEQLAEWAAQAPEKALSVQGPSDGAGLMIDEAGVAVVSRRVILHFVKDSRGRIYLNSAYVD